MLRCWWLYLQADMDATGRRCYHQVLAPRWNSNNSISEFFLLWESLWSGFVGNTRTPLRSNLQVSGTNQGQISADVGILTENFKAWAKTRLYGIKMSWVSSLGVELKDYTSGFIHSLPVYSHLRVYTVPLDIKNLILSLALESPIGESLQYLFVSLRGLQIKEFKVSYCFEVMKPRDQAD